MCVGTNVCGHKCVWAQMCVGTVVCGLSRVWAQSCVGSVVCGPIDSLPKYFPGFGTRIEECWTIFINLLHFNIMMKL